MIRGVPKSMLFLVVTAIPAAAQVPPKPDTAFTVHPEAEKAIDRIRSPYCPGLMLEVCTSSGGAMLRDSIERMAERGLTSDSIVEIIIGEYGERWRAEPKRSGTGLWAWVIPFAGLGGGVLLVGVVLARRRARAAPDALEVEATPEEQARLDEAIRELEEQEGPAF